MRRLDGGRVEVGDGLAQPVAPGLDLGPTARGQELHDLVVLMAAVPRRDVHQAVEGPDQAVAHPLAELPGGHPGEGDDEEAVDRQDAFGDVAGGQGRDGERLARPRTGLQQRHADGQFAAHFEGLAAQADRGARAVIGRRSARAPAARPRAGGRRGRTVMARRVPRRPRRDCGAPASMRTIASKARPARRAPGRARRSLSSLSKLKPEAHDVGGGPAGVLPFRARPRPGGRRLAVERQRLAHAPLEEVDQRVQVRLRRRPAGCRRRGRAAGWWPRRWCDRVALAAADGAGVRTGARATSR